MTGVSWGWLKGMAFRHEIQFRIWSYWMSNGQPSERELTGAIGSGDVAEVINQIHEWVQRRCERIVLQSGYRNVDALDLAQEVICIIYARFPALRAAVAAGTPLFAYLSVLVRNAWLDYQRRQRGDCRRGAVGSGDLGNPWEPAVTDDNLGRSELEEHVQARIAQVDCVRSRVVLKLDLVGEGAQRVELTEIEGAWRPHAGSRSAAEVLVELRKISVADSQLTEWLAENFEVSVGRYYQWRHRGIKKLREIYLQQGEGC